MFERNQSLYERIGGGLPSDGHPSVLEDRVTSPRERPSAVGERGSQEPERHVGESNQLMKTGTTTVALAGADGVVLAADTRASLGGRFVTNRRMRKIEPIGDAAAVAFAGSVADAQAFVRHLRAEGRLYELRHGRPPSLESLATVAGSLVRGGQYRILDLLLAGICPVTDDPTVYDVGMGGGVMETSFAANGSGMQLAYGALESAFRSEAPVADLESVAVAAVASASERDTASGDGMTVTTIARGDDGAPTIDTTGFDAVDAARDHALDSEPDEADEPGEVAE